MTRMEIIRVEYRDRLMNQLVDAFNKLANPNLSPEQEQALYKKWQDITTVLKAELGMSTEDINKLLQQRMRENA